MKKIIEFSLRTQPALQAGDRVFYEDTFEIPYEMNYVSAINVSLKENCLIYMESHRENFLTDNRKVEVGEEFICELTKLCEEYELSRLDGIYEHIQGIPEISHTFLQIEYDDGTKVVCSDNSAALMAREFCRDLISLCRKETKLDEYLEQGIFDYIFIQTYDYKDIYLRKIFIEKINGINNLEINVLDSKEGIYPRVFRKYKVEIGDDYYQQIEKIIKDNDLLLVPSQTSTRNDYTIYMYLRIGNDYYSLISNQNFNNSQQEALKKIVDIFSTKIELAV